MEGCIGCLPSPGKQDAELQKTLKDAKDYAVTKRKNVFVYKDENLQWRYMEAEAASAIGIQPTGGIVSFLQPTTA